MQGFSLISDFKRMQFNKIIRNERVSQILNRARSRISTESKESDSQKNLNIKPEESLGKPPKAEKYKIETPQKDSHGLELTDRLGETDMTPFRPKKDDTKDEDSNDESEPLINTRTRFRKSPSLQAESVNSDVESSDARKRQQNRLRSQGSSGRIESPAEDAPAELRTLKPLVSKFSTPRKGN